MTKEDQTPKARSEKGVLFSWPPHDWPPIVVGAIDPLRQGCVQ